MGTRNSNKQKEQPPSVGGGPVQVPMSAVFPKVGHRYEEPPDRQAMARETQERLSLAEDNQKAIVKIADWLIDLERAPEAEQAIWVEEKHRQVGQMERAAKDTNPLTRKVGAYQTLRWVLARLFTAFSQIGQALDYLVGLGVLVVKVLAAETEGKNLLRFNGNGYEVNPEFGFSADETGAVKVWFTQAFARVREVFFKNWEALISQMEQASNLCLEEVILGVDGRYHLVVPPGEMKDKTGKKMPLEGGHLLISILRGRITVSLVAGNPEEGKGFHFVSAFEKLRVLKPRVYLPVSALRYWTPIPKIHPRLTPVQKEKVERIRAFYKEHPEHAKAVTLFHAVLRRTIEAAYEDGSMDYQLVVAEGVGVSYLKKRERAGNKAQKKASRADEEGEAPAENGTDANEDPVSVSQK